uniref:DNA topoisomerase (ATP-hydrolyzing) n=1 Tax=Echeneis naucrates TaxID=173247 RepID=A0A665VMH9_ECHNA
MTSLKSLASELVLSEVSRLMEVLTRIEGIILEIVTSLSKGEAPVLTLTNRSSWSNISFDRAIGLQMSSGSSVSVIRSDCPSSVTKFAQILKILSVIYRLVQRNSYATKRDIYYDNTQLFSSQKAVDHIVDDISCMLKVPRRSLHVFAQTFPFHRISSNIGGIRNIVSSAKFVLIVEKDATFQRLLDDNFCTKLFPCIIITGKGVPDVNSRLMVRKLWDTLHIPIFALVDADPHGIEIMCIYKYGSVVSPSNPSYSCTVYYPMWPVQCLSVSNMLWVPKDVLIPLTKRDESKLSSLLKRPYLTSQPNWQKEMELMTQSRVKAEIQSLAAIAPDFLTSIYLPNKLRYGGWV